MGSEVGSCVAGKLFHSSSQLRFDIDNLPEIMQPLNKITSQGDATSLIENMLNVIGSLKVNEVFPI